MKQKYRQNKVILALRIKREGPREVRITVYDVMIGRMKIQRERHLTPSPVLMNTRWWWSPGLGENGMCDLDQRSRPHHWVEKQKWVTKYVWSCGDQQAFHQDLHWFVHHWHPMVARAFAELIPPAWRGGPASFSMAISLKHSWNKPWHIEGQWCGRESLAPTLGRDWIVAGLTPVQKFHSWSPVVIYFLTLWISKNLPLSPGNLKNWCFFKTGALYSKIKIES